MRHAAMLQARRPRLHSREALDRKNETGGRESLAARLLTPFILDEAGAVDQEQNAVEAKNQGRDRGGNLGNRVASICHESLSFNFFGAGSSSSSKIFFSRM